MSLKENWKKVGKDFGELGKDLGSSIVQSVKTGAKAVSDWADKEEQKNAEEVKADVVIEPEKKKE